MIVYGVLSDGCQNGDVRLVDGTLPTNGRVEICYEGVWSTISSTGWGNQEAKIVCAQLGFFPYCKYYTIHVHIYTNIYV